MLHTAPRLFVSNLHLNPKQSCIIHVASRITLSVTFRHFRHGLNEPPSAIEEPFVLSTMIVNNYK